MSDAERIDILDVQTVDIIILDDFPGVERLVVHAHSVQGQALTLSFDKDALSVLMQAMQVAMLAKTGTPSLH